MRLICPIAFVLVSASLLSQQSPIAPNSGEGSNAATILISAQNKDGSVSNLSAADLELKLDGRPLVVRDVRHIPRPALYYCALFDSSGSQRPRWVEQRDETTRFLTGIPRPGADYGLLIPFSDEPHLEAQGTDPQKLILALSNQISRGATALYDTLAACADALSRNVPAYAMRSVFLFSDGEDNSSHLTSNQARDVIVKAGMRFYAFGDFEGPHATSAMKHFAEASGGKVYLIRKPRDFDSALTDLNNQLGNLFVISTGDPLAAGRVYKLEVKSNQRGSVVTAPREYFMPSQ
jgi:hypothetical protein